MKSLDVRNRKYLFDICSEYFNGNLAIPEWQIGSLKILPKEGDLASLINWRGINLLDVVYTHMSLVITSHL